MSVSGGVAGAFPLPAGKTVILGGQMALAANAPTAGSLRLYPVFLPVAQSVLQLGVNVTVAGAAGATVQPAVYACDAFGQPAGLLHAGPVLAGDAVAVVFGADVFTFRAGWLWVGALPLSAGATPTVMSVGRSALSPNGPFAVSDNAAGAADLAFQSGLAALPNPFAGTLNSGAAPAVHVTT